jgi:hypothetical protein
MFGGMKRSAMVTRLTTLSCLGLLAGCSESSPRGTHTIEQFSFITTNTTNQEVTNLLGAPDAITGSGVARFQYYLTDRSYVRIWFSEWGSPTSTVVMLAHGTNFLLEPK